MAQPFPAPDESLIDEAAEAEIARAIAAVQELRGKDFPGLLVCSGSEEENALAELADVVVDGPGGVLELLRGLADDIRSVRA